MMNDTCSISASLMCAEISDLSETFSLFEKMGVEFLHIDVMDGEFISNLGLGTDFVRNVRKMTDIPLDFHLMITKPEEKLSWFDIISNDIVSVHYESTYNLNIALNQVGKTGARKFVALNPGTPISAVDSVLEDIDGITILTVNPGFAGQKIIKSCIEKTKRLREYLDANGYSHLPIEVDGNITLENAAILKKYGASIFVAGTSCLFNEKDKQKNLVALRNVLG